VPYPADTPRPGEIYWADLNPVTGSEQAGRRPVLVISPTVLQSTLPVVVTTSITTTIASRNNPLTPILPAGHPLSQESAVLTFQVRTLDQTRLDGYLGILTPSQMAQVRQGIARVFGLLPGRPGPGP